MRRVYLLLIALSVYLPVLSQGTDQQIVDHTFSFIRNIEWPPGLNSYSVKVITQDRSLSSTFESFAASNTVNGKPVEVSFSSYISIPERVDILFVSSQYNGALQVIIDRIAGKPILIITENSPDQEYVMINLIPNPSGGVTFEFNRANIINQGLQTTSGFDRLGGTAINVAKLYKQARDSVRALEQRSKAVEERIDSLNLNAAVVMKIASDNIQKLDEQQLEIDRRQVQLDAKNQQLDSLATQLKDREDQLAELGEEILSQEAQIVVGQETLSELEVQIEQRNKDIAERESKLQQMVTVVDSQQEQLILLISFSVFLVVALILAYRAYQARRRAAKTLNQQKEELKELLDELQSTQTQLVQSEKMASLGVLTAGIAHEINNAINYVYSGIHVLDSKFAELKPIIGSLRSFDSNGANTSTQLQEIVAHKNEIELDSSEEVIDTMIRSIRVGAERTIDIVKGLRTFSRAQEENMSEIDIHDDVNVALLLLKNKIKHTVTIEKDLASNLPTMYGYSGQIGQALLNIIGNAIDACGDRKNSRVRIRTRAQGSEVLVTIRDNGVGIKKEDLDKIFDPFYTTKKIGEGTGLGLSITYGIIEKHNGSIDVNSVVGKGTEFKIKLPLNAEHAN